MLKFVKTVPIVRGQCLRTIRTSLLCPQTLTDIRLRTVAYSRRRVVKYLRHGMQHVNAVQ